MPLPWSVRARIKLKTAYKRITLNRLTATFFIFGLIHCVVQGLIHSFLFSIDAEYNTLLTDIVQAAQVPPQNHTYWDGSHQLVMCDNIPHTPSTCSILFDTNTDIVDNGLDPTSRGQYVMTGLASGLQIRQDLAPNGSVTSLTLTDRQGDNVTLSSTCTSMLVYPQELLQNYKREDLTWVIFQFWLLALSLTAMINNSVPHVLALFFARLMTTMWAIYAIYRTVQRKETFTDLIEQQGTPCSIELFTVYNQTRLDYEIPDLILSCSAFGIAVFLTWKMRKIYTSQSFSCIGAPKRVWKIYKYFLALQACLQMEVFVLVTAMGLWDDQLFNTYIHELSSHDVAYEAAVVTTTVVLIPWIIMGWYAIQREMKILMGVFLFLTFGLISGWSVMFYSRVYRWSFIAWPNLGCWIVTSFVLLILTMTLGIICWKNFGQGLAEYLRAEAALAESDFKPSVFDADAEKAGISWDPPPLTKVSIQRPDDPEKSIRPVPTFYLPNLSQTENNRHSQESIASFWSPGSPDPRRILA